MTCNILLVENQTNWYELTKSIIREENHLVLWAKDKNEARELLEREQIDMAIVNLNLLSNSLILDETGYQILEELRNNWPKIPVIVLSALKEPDDYRDEYKKIDLFERYKVKRVLLKRGAGFHSRFVKAIREISPSNDILKSGSNHLNLQELLVEAKKLSLEGELKASLRKLTEIHSIQREADLHYSRLIRIEKEDRKGTMTSNQVQTEITRITDAILQLIASLEEE